jgi:sugar O-acyltransferase (sialic acid O-acetyltransferase NeuD family)
MTARERPVVVLGGRGGGAIAAMSLDAVAEASGGFRLAGFLNDAIEPGTPLWGTEALEAWETLPDDHLFLAPLHASAEMRARWDRVSGLGIPDDRWATIVDPRAFISRDVSIAPGCVVGPGAMLGHEARIGSHTAVRHGAHVAHDVTVGTFSFIGVNAVVTGYVTVGDCVHVAPGAMVREHLKIGDDALVGLGAVVVEDLPPGVIVAGNPARVLPKAGS